MEYAVSVAIYQFRWAKTTEKLLKNISITLFYYIWDSAIEQYLCPKTGPPWNVVIIFNVGT